MALKKIDYKIKKKKVIETCIMSLIQTQKGLEIRQ